MSKLSRLIFSVLIVVSFTQNVFASAASILKSTKVIVCQATAYYEEETPEQKLPASGIKLFLAGTREDVKKSDGAFLLSELNLSDSGNLAEVGNQQYYLSATEDDKIKMEFIAPWKASGELTLGAYGTARGYLNQKSHITELSCILK